MGSGAWTTPSCFPEPGQKPRTAALPASPLLPEAVRDPAAFRPRSVRAGEPNCKDLLVMVGAGGGAHSGALNFSASPTASLHSAREKPHFDASSRSMDRRPHCVASMCGARPAWKPRVGAAGCWWRALADRSRESSDLLALRRPPFPRPPLPV